MRYVGGRGDEEKISLRHRRMANDVKALVVIAAPPKAAGSHHELSAWRTQTARSPLCFRCQPTLAGYVIVGVRHGANPHLSHDHVFARVLAQLHSSIAATGHATKTRSLKFDGSDRGHV